MKRGDFVIYIDRKSKEHNAQVVSVIDFERRDPVYNPEGRLIEPSKIVSLDPPILDIVYVTDDGVTVQEFGLRHISSDALNENNPDLPRYVLNCWKNVGEVHKAPQEDHPIFDHPCAVPQRDEEGHRMLIPRPKTDADVAAHNYNKSFPLPSNPEPDYAIGMFRIETLTNKAADKQIAFGDIVKLNSGGPEMEVINMITSEDGQIFAECRWKVQGAKQNIGTMNQATINSGDSQNAPMQQSNTTEPTEDEEKEEPKPEVVQ